MTTIPGFLAAVLIDPNLHADDRVRLHRQITEVLRSAQAEATPDPKAQP
jgi:hypothetical protein